MNHTPLAYVFNKTNKTVQCSDFTVLERILLITNVTTNTIIYNFGVTGKGGTLSGTTLTLAFDTAAMNDTDKLIIVLNSDVVTTQVPNEKHEAVVVSAVPQVVDRIGFVKAITGNVDSEWGALVGAVGAGMAVNQTGGNLVVTSGVTARSETIIRSNRTYSGGIRLRARTTLSQRIANNNFFVELVDVIGDALSYTIASATSMTVTFPAGHGFTSENVGQSMHLGGFAGTGTFLSGRYAIASVSGNVITFTVAGFAAGTGTCSAFGWNYYQLQYQGTVPTNATFDTQFRGYNETGTAEINTTATPGHIAVITGNDLLATFADQLSASSITLKQLTRANRDQNVPGEGPLRMQLRIANGATAPASTTTWTVGSASVSNYAAQDVAIQDVRPMHIASALPMEVVSSVALSIIGSVGVLGTIAHDAVDSGSPMKIGGKALTVNPVAVASLDRVDATYDKLGRQITAGSIRELKNRHRVTITSSVTETTIVAAVAATFRDIHQLIIVNTSATTTNVTIRDGTAGAIVFVIPLAAGEKWGFVSTESAALPQTAVNTNWTAQCSVSVASVEITTITVNNI